MKTKNKSYGKILVEGKELDIINFIQATFKDNRLVTVSETEIGTFAISIKNKIESGRYPEVINHLTKDSFVAMLGACAAYFMQKNENLNDLIREMTNDESFSFNVSDNLYKK